MAHGHRHDADQRRRGADLRFNRDCVAPGFAVRQRGLIRAQETPDALPDVFTEEEWEWLSKHFGLSRRQRQVTRLLCRGCTLEAAAARLGVAVDTVRMHMRILYRRLDVHDRVGLLARLVLAVRSRDEFE